jgi:transmembrane 9 superfamily protein 3
VGPYRNPQETYEYYSLPFCQPSQISERSETLGEALSGYELVESEIKVHFKKSAEGKVICDVKDGLTQEQVDQFKHAVENQYWFEFFLDELPIWGLLGDTEENGNDPYIWIHKSFLIKYNHDRIIEVTLTQDHPFILKSGVPFSWTYSISWQETDTPFEDRFDRYLDDAFFEHQIHWFSIFNSFMMVIFLVGLVIIILLRTLKRDISRFMKEADDIEDNDVPEESGWKQVHGDVFRAPPHITIFSALIGIGSQLLVLVLIVILLSIIFYHNHPFYRRGTIPTAFVVVYAFTAFVSGYMSGSYYMKNGGKNWIKCFVYTASIFPGTVFTIAFILNFISLSYGSLSYIPVSTMFIMLCLWLLVSFPITFVGTVLGKNVGGKSDNPCRVHPMPKAIPAKRLYQELWVHVVLGGILPFGSIFIEMYFVFTAFWQYKYYYVFGFLLFVYLILLIVTVCVTIVSTYFLLNAEDYRWQWVSFLSGASTAGYVYLYAIYYFYKKTKMTGFLQISFYFGYTGLFCFGLALLTGAVGFLGAQYFVRRIYKMIHVD